MNSLKSNSSDRSYKVVRIKRKASQPELDKEKERDYLLETGGNIRNYLEPNMILKTCPRYHNGKIVPYSIIGPISLFSGKTQEITRNPARKNTNSVALKSLSKARLSAAQANYESRFEEVMKKINDAKNRALAEEKEELKKSYQEESRKLYKENTFDDLKNSSLHFSGKYGSTRDKFELVKPNKKSSSQIVLTRKNSKLDKKPKKGKIDSVDNLSWYMSLRESPNAEYLDTYMRVGNELGGLYTRIKKPNPIFKPSNTRNFHHASNLTKKTVEIEIVGTNKLDLEVAAVKNVGYEYLRPELLEITRNQEEEIFEENYDSRQSMFSLR